MCTFKTVFSPGNIEHTQNQLLFFLIFYCFFYVLPTITELSQREHTLLKTHFIVNGECTLLDTHLVKQNTPFWKLITCSNLEGFSLCVSLSELYPMTPQTKKKMVSAAELSLNMRYYGKFIKKPSCLELLAELEPNFFGMPFRWFPFLILSDDPTYQP